jgi:hypothetical protein
MMVLQTFFSQAAGNVTANFVGIIIKVRKCILSVTEVIANPAFQ